MKACPRSAIVAGLLLLPLHGALAQPPAAGKKPAAPPANAPAPLMTLTGHTNGVFHVAYSPDGKLLATSSKDHTVKLWDAASGKEVRALKGHANDVYSTAFRPDGKVLASASEDKTIRLWEVATGKELQVLRGHSGDVYGLAFSPEGKVLASGSMDHEVRLWDAGTGKELRVLRGHGSRVCTVAFSPDGKRLASACGTPSSGSAEAGGEVKVWGLPAGRELLSFQAHRTPTWGLAFSRDGARLATVSGKFQKNEPGEVKVWSLAALPAFEGPAAPADRKGLEALWADLGGADAARAYRAVWALSAAPRLTVPFLHENARPIHTGRKTWVGDQPVQMLKRRRSSL